MARIYRPRHPEQTVLCQVLFRIPRRGRAAMIRKVYEVDPLLWTKCGGKMRVIAFITEFSVVDRIINHLRLTFVASKPPPSQMFGQVSLTPADESGDYF